MERVQEKLFNSSLLCVFNSLPCLCLVENELLICIPTVNCTCTATLNVTLHSKCQLIKILISLLSLFKKNMYVYSFAAFSPLTCFDSQQRLDFLYASHKFKESSKWGKGNKKIAFFALTHKDTVFSLRIQFQCVL